MTQEIDIAALRKAAQKATRGPWKWTGAPGGWDAVAESGGSVICELRLNHPENAGHIAAANPAVILALLDRLEQAEEDAARYLALRQMNWFDSQLCVVANPLKSLRLGAFCPSVDELDKAIDAAMRKEGK